MIEWIQKLFRRTGKGLPLLPPPYLDTDLLPVPVEHHPEPPPLPPLQRKFFVEEVVLWNKEEGLWIWISPLLGKDEREWKSLEVSVAAGKHPTDPSLDQKGERIRMILAYDRPEDIMGVFGIENIIMAATHKSIHAEPVSMNYNLASVMGMDAGRRSRLYIASPGPFTIEGLRPEFKLSPAAVSRFRERHPEISGSLPVPQSRAGQTFYADFPEMLP